MKRIYVSLSLLLLVASGCSSSNWRGEAVREQLSRSSNLGTHQVAIDEYSHGVITLSGNVSSEQDRSEIERITRTTSGVREVRNQLTVAPSSIIVREGMYSSSFENDPKQRFTKSDAQIESEVRDVLARNRDLDLRRVDINTRDGIVTLRGSQDRYRDIERLVALTSSVTGVRAVRNELIVAGGRYSQIPH